MSKRELPWMTSDQLRKKYSTPKVNSVVRHEHAMSEGGMPNATLPFQRPIPSLTAAHKFMMDSKYTDSELYAKLGAVLPEELLDQYRRSLFDKPTNEPITRDEIIKKGLNLVAGPIDGPVHTYLANRDGYSGEL